MKKNLFIFATMFAAAFPAAAQWRHFGEVPTRPTGYFGIGFSAPVNPAARNLDPGWNLGGGVGVMTKYVGVMLDATFNDFGINRSALQRARANEGSQKYWALTVNPQVRINPRGPVDFYITGGGGLYSQVTHLEFRGPDITDYLYKPGVNGGVGFTYLLDRRSHLRLFIEARYHHTFTRGSGASFIPMTAGLRF